MNKDDLITCVTAFLIHRDGQIKFQEFSLIDFAWQANDFSSEQYIKYYI